MPFGKYKGIQVSNLPLDYLYWLNSIILKDPLKTVVLEVCKSEKYKKYLNERYESEERANKEIQRENNLKKAYMDDPEFWGRVSPNSTAQAFLDNRHRLDKLDLDTWKWILKNCDKTPF